MKNFFLIIGLVFVALFSIIVYIVSRDHFATRKTTLVRAPVAKSQTSHNKFETEPLSPDNTKSTTDAPLNSTDNSKDEIEKLRRELKTTKAELERLSRPLSQDMLSSTVSAEISPGETLVTGGYMTPGGNYEFTFIKPRDVTLSDGRKAIEIDFRVLSAESAFVEENQLATLATNARNTLQHAEAWKQGEWEAVSASASKGGKADVLSCPSITTLQSKSATVTVGKADGTLFALEAKVEKNSEGNFSIQSRLERTALAQE